MVFGGGVANGGRRSLYCPCTVCSAGTVSVLMENFDPMTSVVFAQTGGVVFGTCGSTSEVVDQQ